MTKVVGSSRNVSIVAPSNTQLGLDAASLSPGQSRKLQTTLPGSLLSPPGEDSNIIRTAAKAAWNSTRGELRFIGKRQQDFPYHLLAYDEASNTWSLDADPLPPGLGQTGHGYDHNCTDRVTGDHIYRPINDLTLRRWNGSSWSTLPNNTVGGSGTSIATTVCGMPEGVFYYDRNRVSYFDGSNWQSFGSPPSGVTFHLSSDYNALSDTTIYGGGNGGDRRLFKLPPNRVITQIADAPVTLTQLSGRARLCSAANARGFMLQEGVNNTWWFYNVDTNQWQSVSASSGDGSSPQNGAPNITREYVICAAIENYDVTMWIAFVSAGSPGEVWLYKHG